MYVICPEAEVVAVRPRRAESPANEAGQPQEAIAGTGPIGLEGSRVYGFGSSTRSHFSRLLFYWVVLWTHTSVVSESADLEPRASLALSSVSTETHKQLSAGCVQRDPVMPVLGEGNQSREHRAIERGRETSSLPCQSHP